MRFFATIGTALLMIFSVNFVFADDFSPDVIEQYVNKYDDKISNTRHYSLRKNIAINSSVRITAYAFKDIGSKPPPKSVILHFTSQSDSWKFINYHDLFLLFDGKRLSWIGSQMDWRGSVENGFVLEHMIVNLSSANFKRFAYAQEVEGELGSLPFKLSYADREGLRALYVSAFKSR